MRNPALELEESRIRWAAVVNRWKKESEMAINNSKQLRASYSNDGIGEERFGVTKTIN